MAPMCAYHASQAARLIARRRRLGVALMTASCLIVSVESLLVLAHRSGGVLAVTLFVLSVATYAAGARCLVRVSVARRDHNAAVRLED